jgi:hypothetical protein
VAEPRVIAIDWSGRKGPNQRRAIWLGEVVGGELVRLESGRTRTEIVELLIVEAERGPNVVVGFDFAFSLPAWFLHDRGLTPRALWATLAQESLSPTMRSVGLAKWMNAPEPPFWTTGEAHRLLAPEQEFRQTENDVRRPGFQPKSVFKLVGGGQVGRGSLFGMQALDALATAGFRVWPFDPVDLPLVVEIFPRLLTGAVKKSSAVDRAQYLERMAMAPEYRALAASSEDAFDTAVSAVVMAQAIGELVALDAEPAYAVEGKIWHPNAYLLGRQPQI